MFISNLKEFLAIVPFSSVLGFVTQNYLTSTDLWAKIPWADILAIIGAFCAGAFVYALSNKNSEIRVY